jgi:hypothetical protein
MGDGQNRVGQEHAWSGVAHYFLDFLAHTKRITMHWTFAAGGFLFL